MDKIYIEDLEVYGYHGVNKEEKSMGQKFLISVEIFTNLRKAALEDNIESTINYAELCYEIEEEFKKEKYDLIEKAAEKLANYILLKYSSVERIKLNIKKPWAPIGKPIKYAAVEVDRKIHKAYIGIGSNMGDKKKNLNEAIEILNDNEFIKVTKISKFYTTKPVGYLEQDDFLNGALEIETLMEPEELVDFLLNVEKKLKRERIIKWGPRTIDLDVLLYDDMVSSNEKIILPHPRMHERMFVLEPLNDIAPYLIHPLLNKRIFQLKNILEK
ncbi:bifunctional folate synthesis protein [Clostridium acetireducens DSM 10703]|jgi:dihydroneopterin aldolase/2-amino-4-hydroxy-6-hydroxymethyldihydropteridine diphosphokinase|uniref:Bifunctional folate synthesis protein n=1 Tax=Clostridium acetireducens DSM 10703 TaxID=1121290 RepID=A0A1E8EYE9_9CLOT|nr:2-amino-4-hydroxy-6-hydroxymethyldihydropteridine diphosphokinase [Clostridium acetireducens]OFI05860.1 bifunctional folate synthesis protein [Clostridium acetireducens DSM 10703]